MFIRFANIEEFDAWHAAKMEEYSIPNETTSSFTTPHVHDDGVSVCCQIKNADDAPVGSILYELARDGLPAPENPLDDGFGLRGKAPEEGQPV